MIQSPLARPLPLSSRRRYRAIARVLLAWVGGASLAVMAGAAQGQTEDPAVIDAITKLNKRALEEYDNLNFDRARKSLNEALELCTQKGLDRHPIKGRTHIHLGVVILAEGGAKRDEAIAEFHKALAIQPEIKPSSRVANPEVQSAFADAVKTAPGKAPPSTAGTAGTADAATSAEVEPAAPTEGLAHDPIRSAVRASAVAISVTTDPSLEAKKVVLSFRPDDATTFTVRQLKEYSPGNWSGSIPDTATGGAQVAYTISVENGTGEVVGTHGSESAPIVIKLKAARVVAAKPEREESEEAESPSRLENPTWLFGLGVGSGFGWASGYGDVNNQDKVQPGFAASKLGHVLPEIGYFVSPDLLLSLQVRYQFVSGATPLRDLSGTMCGANHICEPVKSALSAMARIVWLYGSGAFIPYLAGSVGAGQIRHLASFPPPNNVNCGTTSPGVKCIDTVAAGPILAGPGAGFIINATPNFGFTLGVSTLLGFPTFTFHVDLNGGLVIQI